MKSIERSSTKMFDVGAVLSGAMNAGLIQVSIVGMTADGEAYIASSMSTEETIKAFESAPAEIERLIQDDT